MKLIVFRCQHLFFLHWKQNLLRDERDELRDKQRKHRYTVECMHVYRRHFGSVDDTYTLTHLQIAKLSLFIGKGTQWRQQAKMAPNTGLVHS